MTLLLLKINAEDPFIGLFLTSGTPVHVSDIVTSLKWALALMACFVRVSLFKYIFSYGFMP